MAGWISSLKEKNKIRWDGTLDANSFTGDGSQLTGIVGGGAVDSVFTRTGDVVAATNDYTWAQIDKTTSSIADITTKSHTALTDKGTNTHPQIDTHIASSAIHFVNTGFLTSETDPIFNAASGAYNAHIASSAIHFTSNALWASMAAVQSIANSTSSAYATHAASSAIHYTQASITTLGSSCAAQDHPVASSAVLTNVCYGTGDPPAANTTTEGAVFLKYTA